MLQALRHAACLETAAALAPKEKPKQGAVSAVCLSPSLYTAAGIPFFPCKGHHILALQV